MCDSCYVSSLLGPGKEKFVKICSDKNRDSSMLMLIEKILDLENLEKSGIYKGYYFCVGWKYFLFLKKILEEK